MIPKGSPKSPELVPPPPVNDGFDGKLRCPSLADLVQLECLSGARAAIEVSSNGRRGQLFFEHGDLVHAKTETASGESAALEILGWRTGTFGEADAVWPSKRTVELPWQQLLLRVAQLYDEQGLDPNADPARSASRLVALSTLRPPGLPSSLPPGFLNSVPPKKREIVRAARVAESGQVLAGHGEQVDELVDLTAYLRRLVSLIGNDLGMHDFRELVWDRDNSRLMLHAESGGSFVGLEAPRGADMAALRRTLELEQR